MSSRKSMLAQIKSFMSRILKKHQQQNPTKAQDSTDDNKNTTTTTSTAPQATSDVSGAKKPEIAILGAGIGGLALAIGLIKRGVDCKIYDGCKEFSTVGAGIGLGPNSLNAIDLIDSRFRACYESVKTGNERPEFEHSVFDALYAEEGLGENRGWTEGIVGAPYFTRSSAHRKDLLEIMESFIPPGTVQFFKRATEVAQVGDKVSVKFADGTSILVDTVIGCDGIKGLTREVVLKDVAPESIQAEYANMYIYRGILPMKDCKEILGRHGGDAKWFMSKGKGLAIYPISKGQEENFVFFIQDPNPWKGGPGTIDCTKEEMLADLAGFDSRLVKLVDWAKPLRWPIFHHRNTPIYYKGRVCLLGDVAHASSPHQAAGAGQGLEDAVALSHLLSLVNSPNELETAFAAYDAIRRPRATKVVETSQDAGLLYTFMDPEVGEDMQKVVDNANARLHWIWQHDLQADVQKAEADFKARLAMNPQVPSTEKTADVTEKTQALAPAIAA